jgi:CheY-like chemotaxis protein
MSNYITYIDDDEEDIELFRKFFPEESEIAFKIFYTGEDFLKYMNNTSPENYPCLIILDINMPRMDGFKILDLLQRHHRQRNIPMVMFSTTTNPLDKHITEAFGLPFIAKPKSVAEWKEVCANIARHCENPSVRR